MFGIDRDKMKAAFGEFNLKVAVTPPSADPVVQLIVQFILNLSKAFS